MTLRSAKTPSRGSGSGWRSGPAKTAKIVLALVVAAGALAAQHGASLRDTGVEAGGFRRARLFGVASARTFHDVNQSDARAAMKTWFDLVARQKGFVLDSAIDILDNTVDIRERLHRHSTDLLELSVVDYLELESSHLLVPAFTPVRGAQGGALFPYLLLVNPASTATSLAGLKGKNVLVSSWGGSDAGLAWLDVILGREKLGRAASFFSSVKVPAKAQTCILQLFFGSVDACVVDEINLNLAKEMNPQLGKLRVLLRSRPMIETVIAEPLGQHPYQKELVEAILTLHEDPRGRQLLMIMKTDRIVRLQPGDIDSARELWREFNKLPGPAPNLTMGAAPALALSPPAAGNPPGRGKERN